MNDPILDLIISIKNGYMAKKEAIVVPHSSYKLVVLEKLKQLDFVGDVSVDGDIIKKITIELVYKDGQPAITGVQVYSKPGKRMYSSYKKLTPVLGGMGYSFLSTPKGVMTDKEAKRAKLGGELLFSLW